MSLVAHGSFSHPALFYAGAEEYLDGTVDFVRLGLAADERVAVAVPEPNLTLLRRALGTDADRVRLFDMADHGRNPGRIIPSVLLAFADTHAPRRVRIVGEPIWPGRSAIEYPACAQHEALINVAFAGRNAAILCPYDRLRLEAHVLADAERTHPELWDQTGHRDSIRFAPEMVVDDHNVALPLPSGVAVAVLPFDAAAVASARAFAATEVRQLGLAEARIRDVELGVAELAANSVRHGGGIGLLQVWASDGYVVCQVEDRGTMSDPLVGRRRVPVESTSGRGLLLAHRTADLIRMHTGPDRTAIRLHYRRGADGAEAAS